MAAKTGRGAEQSFNRALGGVEFIYDSKANIDGWCSTNYHQITCDHSVDAKAITHEIGHSFDTRIGPGYGFDELANATITDNNGNYVSGINPKTGVWNRENAGYCSSTCPCQEHPVNTGGGNSPVEDFGDMFMNWIDNSFSHDDAGAARYKWMDDRMINWINIINRR